MPEGQVDRSEKREGNELRVFLDDQWTAYEFAALLGHLQFLYDVARIAHGARLGSQGPTVHSLFLYVDRYDFYPSRRLYEATEYNSHYLRRAVHDLANSIASAREADLRIVRLEFASPGLSDLAGIGKVIKEVRLFTEGIIDRVVGAEDRKIAREMARQNVLAKKIANAEKLLKLGEKIELPPSDRQEIVKEILRSDSFIENKLITRQITDIK